MVYNFCRWYTELLSKTTIELGQHKLELLSECYIHETIVPIGKFARKLLVTPCDKILPWQAKLILYRRKKC